MTERKTDVQSLSQIRIQVANLTRTVQDDHSTNEDRPLRF